MSEPTTVVSEKKKRRRSILSFLGSAVVALALTFLIKEPQFTDSQLYVLFLMFFAIGLWITEAIPPFAVSLFIIAYLVFTLGNSNLNSAPEKIADVVLSNEELWETDLSLLPGFLQMVRASLLDMINFGVFETVKEVLTNNVSLNEA